MKYTIESIIKVDAIEDGGKAIIAESIPIVTGHSDDENGMFLKLQSWDVDTVHTDFNLLNGKKIKITIEVLD